jgi:hypothetical protein
MLKNPSDRMIPWNTQLDADQWKMLNEVSIPKREKFLKRKSLGIEESLWYLDELIHLKRMRDFNSAMFAK